MRAELEREICELKRQDAIEMIAEMKSHAAIICLCSVFFVKIVYVMAV